MRALASDASQDIFESIEKVHESSLIKETPINSFCELLGSKKLNGNETIWINITNSPSLKKIFRALKLTIIPKYNSEAKNENINEHEEFTKYLGQIPLKNQTEKKQEYLPSFLHPQTGISLLASDLNLSASSRPKLPINLDNQKTSVRFNEIAQGKAYDNQKIQIPRNHKFQPWNAADIEKLNLDGL